MTTPPSAPPPTPSDQPRPADPPHGYQAPPPGYPPPGYPPPGYPPPGYPPPGYQIPPGYRVPQPPPVSPAGQRLAEFTDRLVAYIIDYAILGAIISVVIIPVYLVAFFQMFGDLPTSVVVDGQQFGTEPTPEEILSVMVPFLGIVFALMLFAALVAYVYEVEMMFRSGQTIGKRIMKIQIVPLEPTATLTRGMAFKRFLVQYGVGAFVPFFSYLDGFWQLWDKPYRQCLHDKWATTVVIKLNP